MEDICEISLLLDFYGQLITERQKEILDLHYNSDYSLGEIAEHLNISRQGVYDNVKKGKDLLVGFERKLGLVGKYIAQKQKLEDILKSLDEIGTGSTDDSSRIKLKAVKKKVNEIIDLL